MFLKKIGLVSLSVAFIYVGGINVSAQSLPLFENYDNNYKATPIKIQDDSGKLSPIFSQDEMCSSKKNVVLKDEFDMQSIQISTNTKVFKIENIKRKLDENTIKIAKELEKKPLFKEAYNYLDVPYVYAGDSQKGFDCSGFVKYIYEKTTDKKLPRTSYDMIKMGQEIKRENLLPGDLVFFDTINQVGQIKLQGGTKSTEITGIGIENTVSDQEKTIYKLPTDPSHVGIYMGQNRFMHASYTYGVTIDSLDNEYYGSRYITGKRVWVYKIKY